MALVLRLLNRWPLWLSADLSPIQLFTCLFFRSYFTGRTKRGSSRVISADYNKKTLIPLKYLVLLKAVQLPLHPPDTIQIQCSSFCGVNTLNKHEHLIIN